MFLSQVIEFSCSLQLSDFYKLKKLFITDDINLYFYVRGELSQKKKKT